MLAAKVLDSPHFNGDPLSKLRGVLGTVLYILEVFLNLFVDGD